MSQAHVTGTPPADPGISSAFKGCRTWKTVKTPNLKGLLYINHFLIGVEEFYTDYFKNK